MKKLFLLIFLSAISLMATAQTKIRLATGKDYMTATLVDNEATRSLVNILKSGPIIISMSDYGGFEKVGALPQSLPTSNSQITTGPGDIMLYQGNNMVIFYGSNSWSYTRLGKIDGGDAESLRRFLGSGNVSLTISIEPSAAIEHTVADVSPSDIVYDLGGNRIKNPSLTPGIYIINGKKTIIR